MLQNIGLTEVLVIAGLAILFFGAKRLPIFAKGLGESKKEFSKAISNDDEKKSAEKKK